MDFLEEIPVLLIHFLLELLQQLNYFKAYKNYFIDFKIIEEVFNF